MSDLNIGTKSQLKTTTGTISQYSGNSEGGLSTTMQLFGLPYQFLDSCDQRAPGISTKIGRKYIENIVMHAPILTIIPGKPKYLPSSSDKVSVTNAFLEAEQGRFASINQLITDASSEDDLKLYDFQSAFIEYYQYVNILCRTAAGFLELGGDTGYKINKKSVNFLSYDWKNYRWNGTNYSSAVGGTVKKAWSSLTKSLSLTAKQSAANLKTALTANSNNTVTKSVTSSTSSKKSSTTTYTYSPSESEVDLTDDYAGMDSDLLTEVENGLQRKNYIQFYVDPDSSAMSHDIGNNTTQSVFKQALDTASSSVKDLAFLMDSGGMDSETIQKLGDKTLSAIQSSLGTTVGGVNEDAGALISRLLTCGKSVVRGENIMMPDIWSGCTRSNSHTVTAHYKAPYGNKLCLYAEVIVPMMHWIALAYPRATTANSYGSPFLVKAYMPGAWTVNLGIIDNLSIKMDVSDGNVNSDGLYCECDVTASITDMYSDISMTPANNPILFANNSSLVDFLATACGLNLIQSQLKTKAKMLWNNTVSNIKDTPSNVIGKVTEAMDSVIFSFVGL